MEKRGAFMVVLLRWYRRYNTEGLDVPPCVRAETSAVTDELDAVGAWARGALEFRVNEKTPLSIVYHKYVDDMEKGSKESISNEEFGKRMRRCYELRNCRNGDKDGTGQVNRIINYTLKRSG
jgi:phage/plasmid-associated DNA primase